MALVAPIALLWSAAGCDPAAEDIVITAPDSVTVAEGHTLVVDIRAPVDFAVEATGDIVVEQTSAGVSVRAELGGASGALTVHAGDVDKEIAVTVEPLAFSTLTLASGDPVAREHGALMASADGSALFLLGGGAYPNYPTQAVLADAWKIDPATGAVEPWELHGDVPAALASRRVAQGLGDIVFLHGGYDANRRSSDELLQIDLGTGEVLVVPQSADRPLPRSLHAFGYDTATNRFIVSAGFYDSGLVQDILDDTWVGEWVGDTVEWLRVNGAAPPPRYAMFYGTDAGLQRFVMASGAGFPTAGDPIAAYDDVWILDLAGDLVWQQMSPAGEPLVGRRNGCTAVDPVTHTLLLFGGTSDGRVSEPGTWLIDLVGDTRVVRVNRDAEPPLRSSSFGTALPGGGFACGFGNEGSSTKRDVFLLSAP